ILSKIFPKDSVPRRYHDRHVAGCLSLTRKPDQRARLVGIDVAEFLYPPGLEVLHRRELFTASEYADPARPARSAATFDRDWSFAGYASRVPCVPVSFVRCGGGCQVLSADELEPSFLIPLIEHCPVAFDRSAQESERSLAPVALTFFQQMRR